MKLNRIILERYKRISIADISLSDVNVLVGGNNSGKSSILQGIHFSITAAATARQQGQVTFASDLLPYNPTPDFSVLRNGTPYLNQTGAADSALTLVSEFPGENQATEESRYKITIYKGRNHGNIGCTRDGDHFRIGAEASDPVNLYSIYVPGLAGVAQQEELRAKAIVRRGVASGDANLYLRNIIYYINISGKLETLNSYLATIFNGVSVSVEFNENKDHRINVYVSKDTTRYPLELAGTGLLQVLQIYSYVTYFSPKLLLLDEPDSHLHPNNQAELCKAIKEIAEKTKCQIILCTHSRHVVEELSDDANLIWLKDGSVQEQGEHIQKLPLLLDLGALDSFDRLRAGQISTLILTEDKNTEYLKCLLEINGFQMNETLIYSYKTSSNLEGANLFVDFLASIAPTCAVIIHRDRDFMTESEANDICTQIHSSGAIPFITEGSDIESYFIRDAHISAILEVPENDITDWKNEIATMHHIELQQKFTRKRDDIKDRLYRRNRNSAPDTLTLLGRTIPISENNRVGKFMMKKINGGMQARFGKAIDLKLPSLALQCSILQEILENIRDRA